MYHLIEAETKAAGDRSAVVHGYYTSYHAMLFPCEVFLFVDGKCKSDLEKFHQLHFHGEKEN